PCSHPFPPASPPPPDSSPLHAAAAAAPFGGPAMYAAAAVAAVGARSIFTYNRGNFMYDRKMRQKQEFSVLKFRTMQADLWREDVRTLVELTVGKMDSYTIVSALLFEFCGELFGPGHLDPGTPQWLLWLYMLALSGAFVYFFLGVFFAMHASVAASAGSARLLTQLVRLPVPSWYQLEGMRTYGDSVEALGASSLLRIPFVSPAAPQRPQPRARGRPRARRGPRPTAGNPPGGGPQSVDPWDLEADGRHVYELQQRPTGELRHVDLVRRAAATWQGFEAFTRVCMTMGTIQLLYAVSYYVIGYVLVQDGEVYGALFVAAIMTCSIAVIVRLDVSLTAEEFYVVMALAFSGPLSALIAGYWWCKYEAQLSVCALMILPLSFAAHGGLLAYVLQIMSIQEQPNRTLLPMRWRTVLYLDVFGWLASDSAPDGPREAGGYEKAFRRADDGAYVPAGEPDAGSLCSEQRAQDDDEDTDARSVDEHVGAASGSSLEGDAPWSSVPEFDIGSPPRPVRPESRGPLSPRTQHSMSHCTRHVSEHVEGVGAPGAVHDAHGEAFDADTYFPAQNVKSSQEQDEAVTGHDNFRGMAPWFVFRSITRLLAFLYFLGMFWCLGRVCGFPDFHLPPLPFKVLLKEPTHEGAAEDRGSQDQAEESQQQLGEDSDPLQVHEAPRRLLQLPQGERLDVQWPRGELGSPPRALSCDASGQYLAVADGFGVYSARLAEQELVAPNASARFISRFAQAPACSALDGQSPRDVSIVCANADERHGPPQHCAAVVMYADGGASLVECPLPGAPGSRERREQLGPKATGHDTTSAAGLAWRVPAGWLDEATSEQIESFAVDSRCAAARGDSVTFSPGLPGCVLVSTSRGRLALLRPHVSRGAHVLVPLWALSLPYGPRLALPMPGGSLHILPGGLALVLARPPAPVTRDARSRKKRAAARASQGAHSLAPLPYLVLAVSLETGTVVGSWALPQGAKWSAVCGGDRWLLALGSAELPEGGGRTSRADTSVWRFPMPRELAPPAAPAPEAASA
ncbi:unnamed protein product, partial [Prorocentrum cordatum]